MRRRKLLNGLTFCVGVATAIVTVLYVLNIFNIDLIGTYADTAVVERAQFFSTLGQKNFCSGFMAFALPLVFYAFLVARGACGTHCFTVCRRSFGGLALAVVDAEGLALGIGAAVLVLHLPEDISPPAPCGGWRSSARFSLPTPGWMQYMRTHVYTQGGKPMLAALGPLWRSSGFAVCAAVWAVLRFALRGRENSRCGQAGPGAGGGHCSHSYGVVLMALANFMPGFPSRWGSLDDLLVFNDDWGTYRGTAWRISRSTLDWRSLSGASCWASAPV